MKSISRHLLPSLILGTSLAHAVPIGIPASADHWVSENGGNSGDPLLVFDDKGSADSPVLHTRFSSDRNEVTLLRFNLAGYDRDEITAAGLRLTNYAANGTHMLRFYGVTDGATGRNALTNEEGPYTDNNWDENATTFSTAPGLEYDANSTTDGIHPSRVTYLGDRTITSGESAEGAQLNFNSAALLDFITNHPDDLVTVLVTAVTNNSGIKRFASREATTLTSGGDPVPAGTYAPLLMLDVPGQRIPASADRTFNKHDNTASGGSGTDINVRYAPTATAPRNEVVALRFDLTGFNPTGILSADLKLTNHRDNNDNSTIRFFGVLDGSTGFNAVTSTEGTFTDNDWPENLAMTFGDLPGAVYDGTPVGSGIDPTRTVNLGTVVMSNANANRTTGTKVSFSNQGFINFLKDHPNNLVTILVTTDTDSNGQKRFASKETTQLVSGDPAVAGTFAPEINLRMTNPDSDGDGLLDTWEITHGYDPFNADSNNNGIPDGEEDPDGDGLNNLGEQARGTDPFNPDTDGDGLSDFVETNTGIWNGVDDTGTNPLVADTDSDGLPDGVENPDLPFVNASQTGTDPNMADTDVDLYHDGAEVARGSDPTDANDVPDGHYLTLQGNGTGALDFGPLTDPDMDIDDGTPEGSGFDWVAITSAPAKNFFGTGTFAVDPQNMSGAYDLFDNKVAGTNEPNHKWLAGSVNAAGGAWVTVEFPGTVSLTSFNVASAEDRPERDPVDWQIQGSANGVDFTPIFTYNDPGNLTLWHARSQVVNGTLAEPTPQYRFLRFACTRVGPNENTVHVSEVQYFGTLTADNPPGGEMKIVSFNGGPNDANFSITWTSQPGDTYRIGYSTTLADAFVATAAANIPASGGATTTHIFANPQPGAPRLFLRVEKP